MECADLKIPAMIEADKHLTLIYWPPDINVLAFINGLGNIMEKQITRRCKAIIIGDFNIRTNDKSDVDTINLLDSMETFDLTNQV